MVELYTEEPLKKRHIKRLSVVADNDIVFVYIIYEIIEKTVKREIDRLKASLLEDSTPDDNL